MVSVNNNNNINRLEDDKNVVKVELTSEDLAINFSEINGRIK